MAAGGLRSRSAAPQEGGVITDQRETRRHIWPPPIQYILYTRRVNRYHGILVVEICEKALTALSTQQSTGISYYVIRIVYMPPTYTFIYRQLSAVTMVHRRARVHGHMYDA